MKKRVKGTVVLVIVILAILYGGRFFVQNIKGIIPLLKSSREDIVEVINTEKSPLQLPAGFTISIYAEGLEKPRVLTRDPAGNLMASIPSKGKVVVLPDRDMNDIADEVITILSGLNKPHGLAVRCTERCELYVAEEDKVFVYAYEWDETKQIHIPTNGKKIINLPNGGNHTTRTILFMPAPNDHKLLTSIGSSCNVCEETDMRRARIYISNADGSDFVPFATGLRNAVFMAIHPVTDGIWATEMGRDLLGDELPPDEINIIEENKNYGWPTCYGKNTHDIDFDKNVYIRNPCQEPFETGSYIDVPAHSSPLGLAFVPENSVWPKEYWNNLLVSYHGSWNRSIPTGYKIVRYILNEEGIYKGEEDFITGWLQNEGGKEGVLSTTVLGRPVDILIEEDGTMYISDDRAGVIYKVVYTK